MASRGDMIKRARERVDARRAARNRESYMATQGRNIIGDGRNVSRIREARANYKLNRPPRWDEKLGRNVAEKAEGVKTAWMRGADLLASGIGAFAEGEKARVDGKFNAPLNVKKGTNAYGWLLDDVIKDEYEDDFKREVKKDNLHWTELNKYAKDKYIGGGQLAKGINARNEGIIGTETASKVLNEVLQEKEGDTTAIKNTIANQAEWLTRTGQPFDRRQMTPAYNPGKEEDIRITYGEEELPAYSDAPTSILEDYGEDKAFLPGGVGYHTLMNPRPLEGYTDRDLEEDELYNERLYKALNAMNPDTLPGWKYTDVNPFTTPYLPIEEDPWKETHPDIYDFTERNYGPGGMGDAYLDEEEVRGRRWGPWRYPKLRPAGQ